MLRVVNSLLLVDDTQHTDALIKIHVIWVAMSVTIIGFSHSSTGYARVDRHLVEGPSKNGRSQEYHVLDDLATEF